MAKKSEQVNKLAAVASVMQVIGKLTGDEPLASEGAAKTAAAVPASKASGKVPTTPE